MTLKETMEYLLKVGPISPSVFMSMMEEYGFNKKDVQHVFLIGLDKGEWHFNIDMRLTLGPQTFPLAGVSK